MKRRHRILAEILLIAVSALPLSAGAGFPTFDLTGYLQEILGYTQDGQQIANEIKNWENELKRWQQLYKAFEDGDLENILGGINGAVGRLDNTLGRYNSTSQILSHQVNSPQETSQGSMTISPTSPPTRFLCMQT